METITQAATPEETPQTQEAQKVDPLAPKFGALARREKSIVTRQNELKAKEAELEKKMAEFEARFKRHDEIYKKAKMDPRPFLEELGWDYNRLSEAHLNDYQPTPEDRIRTLEERLESEQKAKESEREKQLRLQQEEAQRSLEEAKTNALHNITAEIKKMADKYEYINEFEGFELVYDTMMDHYNKTAAEGKPVILALEEACDLVEKFIEEEQVSKVFKTKKFQSKFKQNEPETDKKDAKAPSPTLNNTTTTSSAPSMLPAKTERERIERALAALNKGR